MQKRLKRSRCRLEDDSGGPKKPCFRWSPDLPRGNIRGCIYASLTILGDFATVYAKTAEPIEMPFGVLIHVRPVRNHVLDGG